MKKLLKRIYNSIPFKKRLFSIIKTVYVPPKWLYQHLYFIGTFEVKITKDKSFKIMHLGHAIENDIFWKGIRNGHEKESMKLWIEFSQKSSVIFDVGANTGIYSLVAAAVNENADIYAFEPIKRVKQILDKNIRLNPKMNIDVIEKAVGDKNKEMSIYDPGGETPTSASLSAEYMLEHIRTWKISEWKNYNVDVISLDWFKSKKKIKKIDLIKIDVEGFEENVLIGMKGIINSDKPIMIIESLKTTKSKDYLDFLSRSDYKVVNIQGIKSKNILCLPRFVSSSQ